MTTSEGLFLGQPVGNDDAAKLAWSVNALKQIEKWARQFGAGASAYNNASSGLIALNVQDAIDELGTGQLRDDVALHALCGGLI